MLTSLRYKLRKGIRLTLGENFSSSIHALKFALQQKYFAGHEPEIQLVSHLVDSGDVVVDVGANGADWTYVLSFAVGPKGSVYAFEADPYYAAATRKAIRIVGLDNVQFYSDGLGEDDGEVQLCIRTSDGRFTAGTSHVLQSEAESSSTVSVRLRRLDDIAIEHPELWETTFFKCDVEGYELFVLRGAREILRRARPVLVVEFGHFGGYGYSERDVYRYLDTLDYDVYSVGILSDGNITLDPCSLNADSGLGPNRVVLPTEKVESVIAKVGSSA